MNKSTKKVLALAAAVTSLSASLGVVQAAENLETHAIKGGNNGIIGPTDSHGIKWNETKGSSTKNKGSHAIKWEKKASAVKLSTQSKGAHYSKFDGKRSQ